LVKDHPNLLKDHPNLLKNKPDGNARRFSAFINSKDLLPNLRDARYSAQEIIEEVDEETENFEGIENQSKSSSKSLVNGSHNSDLNSSYSSIASLPKNDIGDITENARRAADKYESLSDYWKDQAQRRRSRIGIQYSEDLQRFNQIRNLKHPKERNSLTPRQRQLLSQASGDKNLDDGKYGNSALASRHISSKTFVST
jgi:hypothetical protein